MIEFENPTQTGGYFYFDSIEVNWLIARNHNVRKILES